MRRRHLAPWARLTYKSKFLDIVASGCGWACVHSRLSNQGHELITRVELENIQEYIDHLFWHLGQGDHVPPKLIADAQAMAERGIVTRR